MVDWGAILLKFWVDVSPETQLQRFEARESNPAKRWKITAEDWRNRDKVPPVSCGGRRHVPPYFYAQRTLDKSWKSDDKVLRPREGTAYHQTRPLKKRLGLF